MLWQDRFGWASYKLCLCVPDRLYAAWPAHLPQHSPSKLVPNGLQRGYLGGNNQSTDFVMLPFRCGGIPAASDNTCISVSCCQLPYITQWKPRYRVVTFDGVILNEKEMFPALASACPNMHMKNQRVRRRLIPSRTHLIHLTASSPGSSRECRQQPQPPQPNH